MRFFISCFLALELLFHSSAFAEPENFTSLWKEYSVGGFFIGMSISEFNQALTKNNLAAIDEGENDRITTKSGLRKYYKAKQTYLNGLRGVDELSLIANFTPPTQESPQRVHSFLYRTRFGEGITSEKIIMGLLKRYPNLDKPVQGITGPLLRRWQNGIQFEVDIRSPSQPGDAGTLTFNAYSTQFFQDVLKTAKGELQVEDSLRSKDKTTPQY